MKNNLILFKRFLSFICSILIFISVFSGTGLTVCAAMVTRGGTINYSSYIPGSNWQTHYYYVDGHLAYCVQSELAQVNDGDYGTIIETFDTYPLLCKVLFYGYGGPAYKMGEFFSKYGITLTEEQAYLYTHIAANYAYGGNVWHGLDASTAEALHLTDWIVYCSNNVCLPENKHLTGGIVKIATPAGAQRVAYLDSFTFEPISVSVEVKFNFDKTKNTYGDATTNDAVYGIFDSADTELQRITLSTPAGSSTASGDFTYVFSNSGTYYVKEITAPMGYTLDTTKYYFTVDTSGQSATSSDVHFSSVNSKELSFTQNDETPVKGRFTFTKKDSSGNPLSGAGFDVYLKSFLPVNADGYDYSAATPVCGRLSSDASGTVTSPDLEYGTYVVHEAVVPEGKLPVADFEVGIDTNDIVLNVEDKIDNLIQGRFSFVKKDEKGNSLAGAGFDVYQKSSLPVTDGSYDFDAATPICSRLTSDSSGVVTSPLLDYGTYIVHEAVIPEGKLPIDDFEVSVLSGAELSLGDKVDKNIKGRFHFLKTDNQGNPLAGAGFDVYLKKDLTVSGGQYDFSSANPVCSRLVSDASGIVTSPELDFGAYVVHESVVPEGMLPIADFEVSVTSDGSNQNLGTKSDKIILGKFTFKKTDSNGNPLSGAGFDIYLKSDIKISGGKYDFSSAKPVCSGLTSAKDGTVTSPELKYGTYVVHEATVPEGKLPIADFEVSVTSDGSNQNLGIKTDKTIQGKFTFIKKDSDGNPLSGAGFDVYLKSDLTVKEGKYDFSSATPVCSRLTSAKDGSVTSPLLDYGTYVVHESIIPKGKLAVPDFEVSITTDGSNQDLGTKTDKTIQGKFTFIKKDSDGNPLSGAGFDVYLKSDLTVKEGKYDFSSASPVCLRLTSEKDGKVNSPLLDYGTYVVHEAVVPEGKLAVSDFEVEINKNGTTVNAEDKTDKTIQGQFHFIKTDDKGNPLSGAKFDVYLKSDLTVLSGKYDFLSAKPVCSGLTSAADGTVTSPLLDYGTYIVHESVVPKGKLPIADFEVSITSDGKDVDLGKKTDKTIQGKFTFLKKDSDGNPLSGAGFDVYLKSNLTVKEGKYDFSSATPVCSRLTSDKDGKINSPLLDYGIYVVHEAVVPEGKLAVSDFEVEINKNGTTVNVEDKIDKTIQGRFNFVKKDDKGNPLSGAGFDVYLKSELTVSNGKYVFTSAKPVCSRLTSAKDGMVTSPLLDYGTYIVHEAAVPEGMLPIEDFEISVTTDGSNKDLGIKTDKNIRGKFSLKKAGDDGRPVEGAGFSAYKKSSLTKNADGTYDFSSATPVIITSAGGTVLKTDSKGKATSGLLDYGTYVICETVVPKGYKACDPFEVKIEKDNVTVDIGDVTNAVIPAKFRIIKKDSESGETILKPGAKFKIYDVINEVYVSIGGEDVFITDDTGIVTTKAPLPLGTYRIEEIEAPEGYLLNSDKIEIVFDSMWPFSMEESDKVITAEIENTPKRGRVELIKTGKGLTGFENSKFVWTDTNLSGAVYEIHADEDIYSSDNSGILIHAKDDLIGTVTTDTNGKASMDGLYLGKYYLTEVTAPTGYVIDKTHKQFELSYNNSSETPVISTNSIFDEKQKIVLYLTKTDSETGKPLSGAEFGIYAKKDIYSFDGKLLVSGGELIATALSDQNGKVDFGLDLPYGEYIIREIKAPLNYVISKKEFYISAVYPESSVKEISFSYSCANTPVRGSLEITKIGETLSEFKNGEFIWENRPLKGAKFSVIAKEDIYTFDNALDTAGKRTLYFAKNQIIETIETDTNGKAKTSNLPVGKYYLVETNAPYGMILDTAPIDFSIEYNNQNTSLVLSQKSILNERQKITLSVTKSEIGSGKKLSGGKFNLYADDDIKNCNGDVIVPKGTIISSAEAKAGVIDFGLDLPHSVYKITEEKAPSDYYENNTEYEIDLSYTDPTINNQTADLSIFDTRLAHFAKVMMRIKPVFKSKSKSNYITEDNGENGYSILLVSDGSALPVSTAYNTWFCLFVSSILLVAGSLLTVFYLIKRRKVMKEKERSRYE